MKTKISIYTVLLLITVLVFTSSSSTNKETASGENYTMLCEKIKISSTPPSDATILNQYCANAFAWETFLALNWPAKTDGPGNYVDGQPADVDFSGVGTPGDYSATVWETYADVNGMYRNTAPPPWGENQVVPLDSGEDCSLEKIFKATGKLTGEHGLDVNELFQASGPQWLTAQDGNLVWYEVLIDSIEFSFINSNQLYDPNKLWDFADSGKLWLPNGAKEIKASWRQFTDQEWSTDSSELRKKYKVVHACVPQSVSFDANKKLVLGDYQPTYLGLVGLHIITRTPTAPQLIWASFEHIDNVPTQNNSSEMGDNYTYYNPSCEQRCQVNTPAGRVSPGTDSLSTPNQTVREQANSIGENAATLNETVRQQIIAANPNSVWQYYRLINVQWPNTAVANDMNNKDQINRLEYGGAYPTVPVFGNPVSETYVQKKSCLNCHVNAQVYNPRGGPNSSHPAGYSFVFKKAKPQTGK